MKRLIDDPAIAGELRAEMQRYASEQAQVDMKRVYTGLQASLRPTAAAAAPSTPPARSFGGAWSGVSGATKFLVVAAIGGTGALGLYALGGDEPSGSSQRAVPAAVAVASPRAQPEAATHRGLSPANAPTPQPTAALERAGAASSDLSSPTAVGPSVARGGPPNAGPSSSLELQPRAAETSFEASRASRSRANTSSASRREIAQLARIKALLEEDPAAARRLIRTAQREFPAGLLVEEREGLDVIALFALEESERARKNAQRFVARYPQSPLRPKLERLIADASE